MSKEAKFVDIRIVVVEEEDESPKIRTAYLLKTDVSDPEGLAEIWGQSDAFQTSIAELIISAVEEG